MVRFSVGGGEGSSNPSRKRLRIIRTASRATVSESCEPGFHRFRRDPEEEEEEEELDYGEDRDTEIPEQEEDEDRYTDGGSTSDQRSPSYRRRSYSDSRQGRSHDREDARDYDDRVVSSRRNCSSTLRGCSYSGNSSRDGRGSITDGAMSVTLLDPEVLDCSICYEPLITPIYQCDNGHIACSSCCTKLMNKCPSCSLPIGYNRCRAMEKVLESVRLSCKNAKYGCEETFSYCTKKWGSHEKKCIYAPCSCPISDCRFTGCSEQLYKHVNDKHRSRTKKFFYDNALSVNIRRSGKFFLLQETLYGVLFVIDQEDGDVGTSVAVSCLAHPGMREFSYTITAQNERSSLKFESKTKIIQKRAGREVYDQGFAVIPLEFLDCNRWVTLELCIRHNASGEE